ncbi:hypothetical protein [Candidatus Nitrospira neomarina]|uniref:Uncharacterized protein n=1 Tax=Candidatus Nitrospira neomarina TaxID=3020899 RepID=A0AA96JW62_9BACT|nr:hypothetical protein [Candidatus Nitrospira neomarina]WNM62487.1 hypothetical protein PQG83_01710 [Candidatus Nitrospira neomarina]
MNQFTVSFPELRNIASDAFSYGPFLFALLFNLFITNWAYSIYRKACMRTDPPATETEKNTYRSYFWLSGWFGILLVVVSIGWWFFRGPGDKKPSTHVFQGVFKNLQDYERLTSTEFYLRQELIPKLHPEARQLRHQHFLIIKDKPFNDQNTFSLYYSKDPRGTDPEILELKYTPDPEPKYAITWDETLERTAIKPLYEVKAKSRFTEDPFTDVAYAFNPIGWKPVMNRELTLLNSTFFTLTNSDSKVTILQLENPSSHVAEKITALDELKKWNDEEIEAYFEALIPTESRVLVMLDLTRHTDRELASKAKQIISRVDINRIVAMDLLSTDQTRRQVAKETLFRVEQKRAEEILEKALEVNRTHTTRPEAELNDLAQKVQAGMKTRIIFPTGSVEGDRYYIRALWDSGREDVVVCLAKLFYPALQHTESLDKYTQKIASSQGWYIFAKEKFQIIRLAESAETCGASVTFVPF